MQQSIIVLLIITSMAADSHGVDFFLHKSFTSPAKCPPLILTSLPLSTFSTKQVICELVGKSARFPLLSRVQSLFVFSGRAYFPSSSW